MMQGEEKMTMKKYGEIESDYMENASKGLETAKLQKSAWN